MLALTARCCPRTSELSILITMRFLGELEGYLPMQLTAKARQLRSQRNFSQEISADNPIRASSSTATAKRFSCADPNGGDHQGTVIAAAFLSTQR